MIPQCATIGRRRWFCIWKRAENGEIGARVVWYYISLRERRSSPTSAPFPSPCFSLFFIFLLHRFFYPPYSSISPVPPSSPPHPISFIPCIRGFFYLFLRFPSSSYIPTLPDKKADRKLKMREGSYVRERERGETLKINSFRNTRLRPFKSYPLSLSLCCSNFRPFARRSSLPPFFPTFSFRFVLFYYYLLSLLFEILSSISYLSNFFIPFCHPLFSLIFYLLLFLFFLQFSPKKKNLSSSF